MAADYKLSAEGTFDATDFVSGVGRSEKALGSLEDKARGIGRGLSSAGDALSALGSGASRFGAALTLGVTTPVVTAGLKIGQFALQTASAAETSEMAFTTMLGSAEKAQQMLDTLAEFAAKTPFELSGLITSTQQLLAYGFTAEDVIPMLTAVGDATAALGTGQYGIERVTRALGQMRTRGKVTAEEMLQLTEAGIPAWEYLARAIGTDTAGAMEQVTKGAVTAQEGIDALTKGMEQDFGGMMESQSKTVAGIMSNISDAFEQPLMKLRDTDAYAKFADALGDIADEAGPFVESLLPHMENALDLVSDGLEMATDAMEAFTDMSSEEQEQILDIAAGAVAAGPALTIMGKGLELAGGGLKLVGSVVDGAATGLGRVGDAVLDLATSPATANTMLGKLATTIASYPGPAALAVAGIALLTSGVVSFIDSAGEAERNAKTQAEAMEVLGSAAEIASDGVDKATDSIEPLGTRISELGDDIEDNWQRIADLGDTFADLDREATTTAHGLGSAWSAIRQYAGETELTTQEQGALRAAIEAVNDACGTNYEVVQDAGGAYQVMQDGVAATKDELYELIEAQINQAKVSAQTQKLESLYAEQVEQADDYAVALAQVSEAQDAYNAALEKYGEHGANWALDDLNEAKANLAEVQTQMTETGEAISQVETSIGNAMTGVATSAQALVEGSSALQTFFAERDMDASAFATALQNSGLSLQYLSSLTDTELVQMAAQWDGTTAGIITAAQNMGLQIPLSGYQAMSGLATALTEGGVGVQTAAQMIDAGLGQAFLDLPVELQEQGYAAATALAQAISSGQINAEQATSILKAAVSGDLSTLPAELQGVGGEAVSTLASSMSGATGELTSAASGLTQEVSGAFDGLPDELREKGTAAVAELSAAVAAGQVDAEGAAQVIKTAATGSLETLPEELRPFATQAVSDFAAAIADGAGDTEAAASACAQAAQAMQDVGDTYSWGYHLASNFASGISAGDGLVAAAAAKIAASASAALEHSTPKVGPLRHDDVWGLHLAQNFAGGMDRGRKGVAESSEALAQQVADYLAHSQPDKGPLSDGEWVFGYHAAVNFADGLSSGAGIVADAAEEVAGAAKDELEDADAELRAYMDDMISGYRERGDEIKGVSSDIADYIWGAVYPDALKQDWVLPSTGAVYDSMKAIEAAGYDLDSYRDKIAELADEQADWNEKLADPDVSESVRDQYQEWTKELAEFQAVQEGVTASLDDLEKWQGLYRMKDDVRSTTTAATDLSDALAGINAEGVTFSREFVDYVSQGGEDVLQALERLGELGPEAVQELSDAFRDSALAEREAEINARSLYVNSLKYTDFETQRSQMLDYRETVLDVREALYSDAGLSAAFERTGTSAEGFALDLESVKWTMEDFQSYMGGFTDSVSNGFSQFTKYGAMGLDEWTENLRLNKAEARSWADNLTTVFQTLPQTVDSQAFREAILEGGMEQWGQVIADMADMTADGMAEVVELYNSSIEEGQLSAIEAFKALSPGEEFVQAIVDGMEGGGEDIAEGITGAVTDGIALMAENGTLNEPMAAALGSAMLSAIDSDVMQESLGVATTSLSQQVGNGVLENGNLIYEKFGTVAEQSSDTMLGYQPEFYAVGSQLAGGIASGIQSQIGAIAAAAAETVRAAIAAAQAAASIASPSKVMRDEVGAMLTRGMAVGIEGASGYATRAMAGVVEGAISTARAEAVGFEPAGGYSLPSRASRLQPVQAGASAHYEGDTWNVTVRNDRDLDQLQRQMNRNNERRLRAEALA